MTSPSSSDKNDSYILSSDNNTETVNAREGPAPMESTIQDNSISKSNIPSFRKILATHDGKQDSNKAVNYAIALSNFSGAEIVMLRIVESVDNLQNTSVNVENTSSTTSNNTSSSSAYVNSNTSNTSADNKIDIQGPLVGAMEETISKCRKAGCNNKITYKFRTGKVVDEIVDEIKTGGYDIVVLTSTHIDSWVRSLFSDTRKIISNVNTPVLIVQ